jgi:hypothetical protein
VITIWLPSGSANWTMRDAVTSCGPSKGQMSGAARGRTVIEIGLVEHHRRAAGALRVEPDLDPEGTAELPLDEAVHWARVRLAAEDACGPVDRAVPGRQACPP